jgi:pimeloyl-ACP methyl ester carboxylesterase
MDRPYRSIWTDLREVAFRQDWIDAGGIRTRFAQAGDANAPALIMLHGTGGSWEAFCGNLGAHAKAFNCFAIDMVGSGFSDKPAYDYEISAYVDHVLKFMAAIGVQRASFIGVSLGAWVAARLAVDHPDAVSKMTLCAASGLIANKATMQRIQSQRFKAVDDPSWSNIASIFDNLIHDPANRIDDLIAVRQAVYKLPGARDAMARILVLQDPEIRDRNLIPEAQWRTIKAPTLVIGSVDDPNIFLDTARKVTTLIPNVTYAEMKNVGHWPQFEDPETFNALNLRFLLGQA